MDQNQPVTYDYDKRADVLYISLGPPREAYCVEPEEGILLRVEPGSGQLVGLTILHFKRRFGSMKQRELEAVRIPLAPEGLLPGAVQHLSLLPA
jgi:uncharacterized protein YuzE